MSEKTEQLIEKILEEIKAIRQLMDTQRKEELHDRQLMLKDYKLAK